ncbi:VOC family protein [Micromonospora sp. WMMD882]|uniref:VOC family protein n=1 Tax=Micromonospora sp. WMMD882 TaxID=3015151 RepID=UPI00248D02E4|nr:VOC family protein [Micromonospora sp. WMMD882]WBB81722.1 VOC family protein [Micromonospora sp. WMMD882]
MATIAQISLGVSDCERAGRFWAAALGYRRRPPRYPGDDWILLEPPPGVAGAAIAMDLSASPVERLPRIHLDLAAGERGLDAEVDRLVGLGARRVDWAHYPAELEPGAPPYVVLADPEGNRFCVCGEADRPD